MNETNSFVSIDLQMMQALESRMLQLKNEIAESINQKGVRASGRTAASMYVENNGNEITLYGRKFFSAMQYGSRPWAGVNGSCSFDTFRNIIRQWASDKGLNFGQHKEYERTVSAIAMTIIRKGSKIYRSGGYREVYDKAVDRAFADMQKIAIDKAGTLLEAAIWQWAKSDIRLTI